MTEHEVRLPDIGEGIAQAEVVQWQVAVGDSVREDQPFVDVMTDKATVELPSPIAGVVTRLAAEVGDFVAVGAPLIFIENDTGETPAGVLEPADRSDEPAAPPESRKPARPRHAAPADAETVATTGESTTQPKPEPQPASADTTGMPAAASVTSSRVAAAPAVRRRAAALGIDLASLRGSGPDGHIVHADLDALLARRSGVGAAIDVIEEIPLRGLRRNIARRMEQAHRIPHFGYVESVDVEAVEQLRARLNERPDNRPHLTLLPFLMRAVVLAVGDHPTLNAHYDPKREVLKRFSAVHLGIATQSPNGLMVPVIRHAEGIDIWRYAAEVRRLTDAADDGSITLAELSGSSITITSLGRLGGLVSTPIINAPEVAIVGVNRIETQPVVLDGRVQLRRTMNLSSSFDHRVIDGWDAAQFIGRIKELLESPALLFVHEPGA